MRIFILFIFICIFSNTLFAQELIKDIRWDEEKSVLWYNVPKDSLLKIRAGSSNGPVYRTLVNLEKRKAGTHQQPWNGMDESNSIDFKNFGPLHFCVDALPKLRKDLILLVSPTHTSDKAQDLSKDILQKGMLKTKKQPLSLTLDINEAYKKWFCKDGVEIMIFLDNKLIKLKPTKTFPYSLNLELKPPNSGKHLLSMNVWSGDHASVAYKNLLIYSEAEKETTPAKKTDKPKTLIGKIAYCQRYKDFWQVYTANLDGLKPRRLAKSPVDKRYPSFSPDGKRIAYVTNEGQLWIMNKNGRNNRKISLPVHASQPRWSPDGKRIVFVSYQDLYHGDSEIWEVDLKTLKLKKLTSRPWLQYDPYYSADGTNILFTDGPELYAQDIRKLDLKTGDVIQLTDNGPYDYDMQPVYSPDGKIIAWSSNQGGNYDIWIMDKFGQNRRNLTQSPAYDIMPQITADGKRIFFLSDRTGNLEVWRMDINGANLYQVTKTKKDKQDLTLYAEISTKDK